MWLKQWNQYIKQLDDGNEWIIGFEVNGSLKTVFISNEYMPTNETNSLTNLINIWIFYMT